MQGRVLVRGKCDAQTLGERGETFLDPAPERVRVAVAKNGPGPRLDDEAFEFAFRRAAADDELRADGGEVFRQRSEARAQEFLAVRPSPVVVFLPVAEDVNGDDELGGCLRGGVERGVVGQAQVAPEPMDGNFHVDRFLR